jgi:hypothetical protein
MRNINRSIYIQTGVSVIYFGQYCLGSTRGCTRGAAANSAGVTKGPRRRAGKGGIVLGRTAIAALKHVSSNNPRRQLTAPSTKILVEGNRLIKHIIHKFDTRDVPFRDVLVEGRRIIEHSTHVGDLRDVPSRDVLVESSRRVEHVIHAGNTRDVPCIDVLVEAIRTFEHAFHGGDTRYVPCRDVRVERIFSEQILVTTETSQLLMSPYFAVASS